MSNVDETYQDNENILLDKRNLGGSFFTNFIINARSLSKNIKGLSDIGINFDIIGKKNTMGVKRYESETIYSGLSDDTKIHDTSVPYFIKNYAERVQFLREFSRHAEIEDILEKITDEAIIYNDEGFVGEIELNGYKDEKIKKMVSDSYHRLYSLFGFYDGIKLWSYYYQWMIEGALIFEKIVDNIDIPTKIIGYQELDPMSMIPFEIKIDDEVNPKIKKTKVFWKQVAVDERGMTQEREIPDDLIIYVSWDRTPGGKGKLSYLERLIRNHNLMRTMENTSIAYHVMNSQFRMKILVPVGEQTIAKAKQAVAEVKNSYREDILIDSDSGQVTVNGQANINWGRSIVLPKGADGESAEIDSFSYSGPDLTDLTALDKFTRKFQLTSKLPKSRFDQGDGTGSVVALFGTDGIPYDEQAFQKFIERSRKEFKKIMTSAIYTDCILREKSLKYDTDFESRINIVFESSSMYQLAKKFEVQSVNLENLQLEEGLIGVGGLPLYSKKYLYVDKYKFMTEEEWITNRELVMEELESAKNMSPDQNVQLTTYGNQPPDMMQSLMENLQSKLKKNRKYLR
jgi:hypothetical protein